MRRGSLVRVGSSRRMSHRRSLAIFVGMSAISLVLGAYVAIRAQAQEGAEPEPESSVPGIQFPIPELGNCGSATECEAYCDDLSNKDACVAFGLPLGLIEPEEAEAAKELPPSGPGGCASESACRAYCEDAAHLAECTGFAKEHGVISEADARRAEILLTTGGPGGCTAPDTCRAYCDDSAHEGECFEFAKANGFISEEEIGRIEELREKTAVSEAEPGPGGCIDEASCRAYCEDPAHITECLAFAESKGFISPEDAERIRKSGFTAGPGGCTGEAECRAYCEDPAHQAACIDFAVENGFMTEEEARLARKFAGKTGPGGCTGEQCREYCESPDHAEACLDFAAAEGLMSGEELARARKFMRISQEGGPGGCTGLACRDYCEDPAHQDECFNFAKQQGLIPPGEEKQFEAGIKIRKKMQESGGPGGCRSDDECRVYCTDPGRVEECVAFGAAHGGLSEEEIRRMLEEFSSGKFEARGEFGPPEDIRRFEEEARRRVGEFEQLEEHFRGGPPGAFPGARGEFPGAPGDFPAGGRGGVFPQGFSGPGGCSGPVECIKYCAEHREECFSFGPPAGGEARPDGRPGAPGIRPPEGGLPPGFEAPELRRDLIRPTPGETQAGGSATVTLNKQSSGFYRLVVRASRGVKEFSLSLAGGSNYGGGINGCTQEFVNENASFKDSDFPFASVAVTDCDGRAHQIALPPPYGGAGRAPGAVPPEFQIPPEFQPPTTGSQPPEGFRPEGFEPPSGFTPPDFNPPEGIVVPPEFEHFEQFAPPPGPESFGDPATECASRGGAWTGTECRLPSEPTGFRTGFWRGVAGLLQALVPGILP